MKHCRRCRRCLVLTAAPVRIALLVIGRGPDVSTLAAKLAGTLPAYARPLFLRLQPEIEITGTFKQKKGELVAEGFDPAKIADPIYYLDLHANCCAKVSSWSICWRNLGRQFQMLSVSHKCRISFLRNE